jgi:starch synthase
MMTPLRVLSVASEAVPFVKTGGLADVAGALPMAVQPHGVAMTTLIPGYRAVMARVAQHAAQPPAPVVAAQVAAAAADPQPAPAAAKPLASTDLYALVTGAEGGLSLDGLARGKSLVRDGGRLAARVGGVAAGAAATKTGRQAAAKPAAKPAAKRAKAVAAPAPACCPQVLYTWPDLLGHSASLVATTLDGSAQAPALLVLDCPALYDREGGPYADAQGTDWPDNWRRFAALARAAADIAAGVVPGLAFDVVHAHDWQAGLVPAYLKFAPGGDGQGNTPVRPIPSIMTIHNMAFQGHFTAAVFPELGLPSSAFAINGVEYHGGVGMLKAGLECAWAITTVSPTYAREIRQAEFGLGLEGLIAARAAHVHGVLNGIDQREWNPQADAAVAAPYGPATLERKAANKRALEAEFALEPGDGPLFVVVSRLTWQKGMDVLALCLDQVVAGGGRLALLGSGDAAIVAQLQAAAQRHPGRISLKIGYDEALAHRLMAGGDAILVPSRFEPCGLTQLYGLAYGCVPVVAHTGGLADTVIDANPAALLAKAATGVVCAQASVEQLGAALARVFALYAQGDVWQAMQRNGMQADFSWSQSGAAYAKLYQDLIEELL